MLAYRFSFAFKHIWSNLDASHSFREPASNDGTDSRWDHIDGEQDAKHKATDQAGVAIDFSAHLWSYKLVEHLAWVK